MGYFSGLGQKCGNSSVLAMELPSFTLSQQCNGRDQNWKDKTQVRQQWSYIFFSPNPSIQVFKGIMENSGTTSFVDYFTVWNINKSNFGITIQQQGRNAS